MTSEGEKSFEATPSRVAKAKREGNVVRAQELGANLAFAAATGATALVCPQVGAAAAHALVLAARGSDARADSLQVIAWSLVPMGAAVLGGTLASFAQSGGLRVVMIALKIERLALWPGLKRMVSREAATHGLRAFVGVLLAAIAVGPAMRDLFAAALDGPNVPHVAALAWSSIQHVTFSIVGLGAIFAGVEYGVARREWLKKLRMSFEEFKRERKEQDGDPLARARRKSAHRALARGPVSRVKDASFVVVNPTHIAVALEYRPPDVPVPAVLVRAADELAMRVRELANRHAIPIVENVALARALYADGQIGLPIPTEHYVAVAEVVCALSRAGALT